MQPTTINNLFKRLPHIKTTNPIAILYGTGSIIYCKSNNCLYKIRNHNQNYELLALPDESILATHHSSELYVKNKLYDLIRDKEIVLFYKNITQVKNIHFVLESHNLEKEMELFKDILN